MNHLFRFIYNSIKKKQRNINKLKTERFECYYSRSTRTIPSDIQLLEFFLYITTAAPQQNSNESL